MRWWLGVACVAGLALSQPAVATAQGSIRATAAGTAKLAWPPATCSASDCLAMAIAETTHFERAYLLAAHASRQYAQANQSGGRKRAGRILTRIYRRIPDSSRMSAVLQRACRSSRSNSACMTLAGLRMLQGDRRGGIAMLQEQCKKRDQLACSATGFAHLLGWDRPKNPVRATSRFLSSCTAGEAQGCDGMAFVYYFGDGRSKNRRKAAEFYEKSCKLGLGKSCSAVGRQYIRADGVVRDAARGRRLLWRGCQLDDYRGCRRLSWMFTEAKRAPKNLPRGRQIMEYACAAGHPKGCRALGNGLRRGLWGTADTRAATTAYERSCLVLDDVEACNNLALMYKNGAGVSKKPKRAAALLRFACDVGSATACFNLSQMYLNGTGVQQDPFTGLTLLRAACRGNYTKACGVANRLAKHLRVAKLLKPLGSAALAKMSTTELSTACAGELGSACTALGMRKLAAGDRTAHAQLRIGCTKYRDPVACFELARLQVGAKQPAAALMSFDLSCEAGHMPACHDLALTLRAGKRGIFRSRSAAKTLFKRACKGGHKPACRQ